MKTAEEYGASRSFGIEGDWLDKAWFVSDGELAVLSPGEKIKIKSGSESEFLILAGPDINEPIARYGPFVMNTREEINQAFLDYQNGTLAD